MKIRLVLITIFLSVFVGFGYDVTLTWDYSSNSNCIGYNIYYGFSSGIYNTKINVGNTNQITIQNLTNSIYYFAANDYDTNNNLSDFSNEISVTNSSPVYIGEQINYGTNIFDFDSQSIMTMIDNGAYGNFYSAELIITNNNVEGTAPSLGEFSTTNYYVYLVQLLSYGKSLTNMANVEYDLCTFTNPPVGRVYSEELIITNNPF